MKMHLKPQMTNSKIWPILAGQRLRRTTPQSSSHKYSRIAQKIRLTIWIKLPKLRTTAPLALPTT